MGIDEERANSIPTLTPTPTPVELARKKNIKLIIFIIILIISQTMVYAVFRATVLRVKRPNIKISSVTVENLTFSNTTSSFDMQLITEVTVKNKNWGQYKFPSSFLTLSYGGRTIGEAQIPSGKAKLRSTRRMNVTIDVTSDRLSGNLKSNLASDLKSGNLTLNAYTELRGQATLMLVIKKNKSGLMNCAFTINAPSQTVQEIICK